MTETVPLCSVRLGWTSRTADVDLTALIESFRYRGWLADYPIVLDRFDTVLQGASSRVGVALAC